MPVQGSDVTAVFWGTFATARGLAIFAAIVASPNLIMWGSFTISGLGAIGLAIWVGGFLSQILSCSNFYMLPFCSPCHAISKTVFVFTLALLFLMWVLLAQNGHFYNVNLAQNLKTVVTFYWNVRLS